VFSSPCSNQTTLLFCRHFAKKCSVDGCQNSPWGSGFFHETKQISNLLSFLDRDNILLHNGSLIPYSMNIADSAIFLGNFVVDLLVFLANFLGNERVNMVPPLMVSSILYAHIIHIRFWYNDMLQLLCLILNCSCFLNNTTICPLHPQVRVQLLSVFYGDLLIYSLPSLGAIEDWYYLSTPLFFFNYFLHFCFNLINIKRFFNLL